MPRRVKLSLETEARNAYYRDPGRRAWALVAFMVEHEKYKIEPDGTRHERESDKNGRLVFRGKELHKQLVATSAGYGGYFHPRAAGNSRTNVIHAMAAEAEREGWITRERDRYGGTYNYALTENGRDFCRSPHRTARSLRL